MTKESDQSTLLSQSTDEIVFYRTTNHDRVVEFYRNLGATVWLEQPDCTILQAGDLRVGFCARETADTEGIVTFVFDDRSGVDDAYARLESRADHPPAYNEKYEIYQFFANDPEGRMLEFQAFE